MKRPRFSTGAFFVPSIIAATNDVSASGTTTITGLVGIEAVEPPLGSPELFTMLFDTRQIVTDGVYGFGDPFEVFDDRNGEVVLAFQSPSITNLSDGLPVTFGAVSGSVSPTSFSTSDGGTLAGTFIATIEGEREIDDDSDNDVTLTGTISGSFNLEIQ